MIKIKFLARKFFIKIFIFQPLFQSAQNFYENGRIRVRIRTCGQRIQMRIRDAQWTIFPATIGGRNTKSVH
jgi:hypothetical protein